MLDTVPQYKHRSCQWEESGGSNHLKRFSVSVAHLMVKNNKHHQVTVQAVDQSRSSEWNEESLQMFLFKVLTFIKICGSSKVK